MRQQVVLLAEAAVAANITGVQQLLAFAMCRHSPLSPTRVLTRDCPRVIYDWLVRSERLVVARGMVPLGGLDLSV